MERLAKRIYGSMVCVGILLSGALVGSAEVSRLVSGDVATDFEVVGPTGEVIRLSDYRGQVVVLDFWATWCGPCIKAMPKMSELASTRGGEGLVVLSICVADTRENYEKWVKENGDRYAFETAHDPKGKALRESIFSAAYGVSMLPAVLVVDRDGKLVGRVTTYPEDKYNMDDVLEEAGLSAGVAEEKPSPRFRTSLGRLNSGGRLPEVTVERLDGESVELSSLLGDGPVMLRIFKAPQLEDEQIAELNGYVERYASQGLKVIALGSYTDRAVFDDWLSEKKEPIKFEVVYDPCGPAPEVNKPREELSDEELAELRAAQRAYYETLAPMTLAGGLMAPVPHTIIADKDYRFIGIYVGSGEKTRDSVGNLFMRAELELAEVDRPAHVYTVAETTPEKPVKTLGVGSLAPDFSMVDVNGKEVKLSDYRGKIVVLDFWATWCGPCKKAIPHLQQVAVDYKDQGVVVLGSCTNDKRSAFEKWIKANGSKYPEVIWAMDPAEKGSERASRKLYGVPGIPTQFIIDREGRIVEVTVGYLDGEVLVDAALAKAGVSVPQEIMEKALEDRKKRERMQ